jgi:hypothetical protein
MAMDQPAAAEAPLLSRETALRGEQLMHRQCSFWGRDIKHHTGNLLLRYGGTKAKDPQGVASRYTWDSDGERVSLWGFGMFYSQGNAPGILLQRYAFEPRLLEATFHDAWSAASTEPWHIDSPADGPRMRLLAGAIRWIERYESWALEQPAVYRPLTDYDFDLGRGHTTAREWQELLASIVPPAASEVCPRAGEES